jgi:hypothetical protein
LRAAARLLGAALLLLAASPGCGQGGTPLRLRHEPKRRLSYTLEQREEAPHPVVGIGGSIDVAVSLSLSCLSADADGNGSYEATVKSVKIAAPPSAGANVDTSLGRPVEGDKIGANAVAMSLLPRTAVLVLRPEGAATGVVSDREMAQHVSEYMRTKPLSSRMVLQRLAASLDAGPLTSRWWNSVASLLPANDHTPPGASWPAGFPAIETPAGTLVPKVQVTYTKEGETAVLTGRGEFALRDAPKDDRMLDFDRGTIEMTARIDLGRGIVVSYDESGSFEFRMRGDEKLPAPWTTKRTLRLVSEERPQ